MTQHSLDKILNDSQHAIHQSNEFMVVPCHIFFNHHLFFLCLHTRQQKVSLVLFVIFQLNKLTAKLWRTDLSLFNFDCCLT